MDPHIGTAGIVLRFSAGPFQSRRSSGHWRETIGWWSPTGCSRITPRPQKSGRGPSYGRVVVRLRRRDPRRRPGSSARGDYFSLGWGDSTWGPWAGFQHCLPAGVQVVREPWTGVLPGVDHRRDSRTLRDWKSVSTRIRNRCRGRSGSPGGGRQSRSCPGPPSRAGGDSCRPDG